MSRQRPATAPNSSETHVARRNCEQPPGSARVLVCGLHVRDRSTSRPSFTNDPRLRRALLFRFCLGELGPFGSQLKPHLLSTGLSVRFACSFASSALVRYFATLSDMAESQAAQGVSVPRRFQTGRGWTFMPSKDRRTALNPSRSGPSFSGARRLRPQTALGEIHRPHFYESPGQSAHEKAAAGLRQRRHYSSLMTGQGQK